MEQLTNLEQRLSDPLWNAFLIVGSLAIGLVIKWIIHVVFGFYRRRTDLYVFKTITKYIQTPATILIPLLALNAAEPMMHLPDRSVISRTIELLLIGSFAFLLVRIVRVFEDIVKFRNDITKADNLKERKIRTQIDFLSRMLVGFIVIIAVAGMLLSFDNLRKIGTGLLAGVGVGSIIIGFAAQSTLSNILAGFQIAFTQPIRLDDVVVVENEWGRIEDITLTYVVVKIWDERRLVLPIAYFIQKPFQNWTRVNSDLLGTVFLNVDYTAPFDEMRKHFKELLKANSMWDGKVAVLQVTDEKDRTVQVRLLMSARNSSDAFDLRCEVREKMITFIQQNYPSALPKTRSESMQAIVPLEEFEKKS